MWSFKNEEFLIKENTCVTNNSTFLGINIGTETSLQSF